ncbi:hypothetical protein DL96DRAFT_373849 [Flagelloscypha sp. PMI_526]|nr:hypothetical protein DL96DRAFT_373849 [Flagelloscypha sp. PMI_526]
MPDSPAAPLPCPSLLRCRLPSRTRRRSRIMDFPLELEREIFELAAWSSSKHDQLSLMLVSRKTWKWIEPIFYQAIVMNDLSWDASKLSALASSFWNASRPRFYQRRLKACYVYLASESKNRPSQPIWTSLSSAFTQLRHLSLCGPSRLSTQDLEGILTFRLHRLTLRECWKELPSRCLMRPESFPSLESITHLRFLEAGPSNRSALDPFMSLSHLAFRLLASAEMKASHVVQLSRLPMLKLLVLTTHRVSMLEQQFLPQSFPRIIPFAIPTNELEEWECSVYGEVSLWTKAEGILKSRNEFSRWVKTNAKSNLKITLPSRLGTAMVVETDAPPIPSAQSDATADSSSLSSASTQVP